MNSHKEYEFIRAYEEQRDDLIRCVKRATIMQTIDRVSAKFPMIPISELHDLMLKLIEEVETNDAQRKD